MKGRPAKPAHLRAIDGNPGKRGNDDAPAPPVVFEMDAPAHLEPKSADLWRRVQPLLARYCGFTELDALALELLCMSFGRYHSALEAMRVVKDGAEIFERTYTTSGRNGKQMKTRPEYVQAQAEVGLMKSLMAELGLTMVSRARMTGVGQLGLPFDQDPLAQLSQRYAAGNKQA